MNMEVMLNKFRSTMSTAASNAVSNAVSIASQVSNYLPGNPVTREYEATEHVASAGRGLMWKVYKGYRKSTKQAAAIFLFEKRQLDKWDRHEREQTLEKVRKGISQLTRLRHPQVLIVQHPLEESRDTLAFATEPVFSSLANILGKHENMPSPLPSNLKDFKLYDVEIKYGLMQMTEGLIFLHNSVKIVHRCISPENIILNHQGAWKLFGFDFCVTNQSPSDQPPLWSFEEFDTEHHLLSQPEMDYLAPEYALSHKLGPAADMFSIGVVIHALYNKGKPVYQNHDDFAIFKNNAYELRNSNKLTLDGIPDILKDPVKLLLNATAELRPDALQFVKISYFEDIGVRSLSYLDQLFQWDNVQKSQFYKSLPQILRQLPHRVALLRVIPCLMNECVNHTMVPFVLPIILQVAENASKEEFIEHILPPLQPIMKITDPMQVMLLLMLKMELLLSKTPAEDVRDITMPLLYRALECDIQQIQELCLSVLPTCVPLVEQSTVKNSLLPRIKKLCTVTTYLSVRVNCLVCIGKFLEYLDKWVVIDDVFPFLTTVPSKEAPVVMAIVGIFKVTLYHKKLGISKDVLAYKVLPFLFPLSIENSLTPAQHGAIMTLIRDMTQRIESEHRTKLEHLDSIRTEQKSLEMTMPSAFGSYSNKSPEHSTDMGDFFTSCKIEAKAPSLPNSISSPTPSLSSNLTLQDKQRLANHQTVLSSVSKQIPLLSSPPAPKNPLNQSSGTSTLINSNLKNLSLVSKSQTTPTTTVASSNLVALSSWNFTEQQISPNPQSIRAFRPTAPVNNSTGYRHPVQQVNSFLNNSMQNNSFRPIHSNSMINPSVTTSFAPMSSSSSNNNAFKPLSSSDINEFLS